MSGATKTAAFTIGYSGGSSTQTVDQSQNNGNGWVAVGNYALTQSGSGQQVSLAENSGGTVTAGAVKIVRDNSGTPNTATHGYTYIRERAVKLAISYLQVQSAWRSRLPGV